MLKYVFATVAAITLLAPAVAGAQGYPSCAQPPEPTYASGEENIHGRIIAFDGRYALSVRDERGFVDSVQLHQGTIINPTGITLEPGMVVSVLGYNAGSFLAANEIDTPYILTVGVPYWAGHPYWYYGPGVSLNLFFGNPGWWHGSYFHGGFRYVGGARVYSQPFRPVYRGGAFQGHTYIAPPARGGYVPHGGPGPRGDVESHRSFEDHRGGDEHRGGGDRGGEHGGHDHGHGR
jgi:hypothetical protein